MENLNKKNAKKSEKKQKKSKAIRFRLLPLVIFFCVLMLSLRIGVVWRSFASSYDARQDGAVALSVTSVQAQSPEENAKEDSLDSKVAQAVADQKKSFGEKEYVQSRQESKSFSQSELEILQKLAQRREELDLREGRIDQRAAVLKAAEAQIEAKIAKLKELEDSIQELVGLYDKKEEKRLQNLVKIYSTMKPKEAARLFNGMEMSLLVRLFEDIKESKAAPILALMTPEKANALTVELANKRTLSEETGLQ